MNSTRELFEQCLSNVPESIKKEIDFSWEMSNRVADYLEENKITSRILANRCKVPKSRVDSWLCGTHKFSEKEKSMLLNLGLII